MGLHWGLVNPVASYARSRFLNGRVPWRVFASWVGIVISRGKDKHGKSDNLLLARQVYVTVFHRDVRLIEARQQGGANDSPFMSRALS
jgi:hypothetical protein